MHELSYFVSTVTFFRNGERAKHHAGFGRVSPLDKGRRE